MYRMGPRQRGQAAHQWTAGSLGWRKGARRPAEVGPLDLDTINPPAARHAFLYPAAILANCGCRFRVSRLLCGKLGGIQRILGRAGAYFLLQWAKWLRHKLVL